MCIYAFLNLKLSTCRGMLRLRARCKAVWFWVSAAHLPRHIVGRKENKKATIPPQMASPLVLPTTRSTRELPLLCVPQLLFETGGQARNSSGLSAGTVEADSAVSCARTQRSVRRRRESGRSGRKFRTSNRKTQGRPSASQKQRGVPESKSYGY